MKKNFEFMELKKKAKPHPPKTYLDYLRESDYPERVKKYYIKNYDNLKK